MGTIKEFYLALALLLVSFGAGCTALKYLLPGVPHAGVVLGGLLLMPLVFGLIQLILHWIINFRK